MFCFQFADTISEDEDGRLVGAATAAQLLLKLLQLRLSLVISTRSVTFLRGKFEIRNLMAEGIEDDELKYLNEVMRMFLAVYNNLAER